VGWRLGVCGQRVLRIIDRMTYALFQCDPVESSRIQ